MIILLMLVSAVIGYLLGSINTSLVVGGIRGKDIRKHGSGNAGTTNALRVLGKGAAIMVLAGDALKGVAACLIGGLITNDLTGVMAAGTGAILGHNWPLYFGFKGGKGVLTSAAVILMMDWKAGLISLGIFAAIVAFTRYVSLGSMVGAALFPVVALLLGRGPLFVTFATAIAALIIARHRPNIERLRKGTESKLGQKRPENGAGG